MLIAVTFISSFYENLADLRHSVPKMLQKGVSDTASESPEKEVTMEGGADPEATAGDDDDEVDIEEVLKQEGLEDIEQLVEKEEQEAAEEAAGQATNQSAKMVSSFVAVMAMMAFWFLSCATHLLYRRPFDFIFSCTKCLMVALHISCGHAWEKKVEKVAFYKQ